MRLALRRLAPAGARGRLTVLIFHRVLERPDPLLPDVPDAATFERRMRWVADWFNVVPLSEAIERLERGGLPERAASITFDDGYADNFRVACPVLRRLKLPATFFVATGFLGGGRMWNDTVIETVRRSPGPRLDLQRFALGVHEIGGIVERRAAIDAILAALKYRAPEERARIVAELATPQLPTDLMMTPEELRRLHRAGMSIGAHTVSHPILQRLPLEQARREIAEGRAALESLIGEPVALFAYPNGRPGTDYGPEHVELVRSLGFSGAVSTAWGAWRAGVDRYQVPRFTPWDRTRSRFALRLARNFFETASMAA